MQRNLPLVDIAVIDAGTADRRSLARFAAVVLAVVVAFLLPVAQAASDLLEPEDAFRLSVRMLDARTIEAHYDIAPGYYMYREAFRFGAADARLGPPTMPSGKLKFDETFQKHVETYRGSVAIRIPVEAAGPFALSATSQGCADAGVCYMPTTATVSLQPGDGAARGEPGVAAAAPLDEEMGAIERSLRGGRLPAIVPLFLLLGLGLAFTPCVLPMVPILSSVIVGDRARASRGRGVLLSAVYALGMAVVYTLFGIAAGLAGEGLAAALQNRWVLGGFALLMGVLALSMFGVFELQIPAAIQTRLTGASRRQAGGKLAGVFAMGGISALVVGPCVAAPLAGTLIYISQTRDVVIGGTALFAMAVGMSVPLLLVGATSGTVLPRAGAWMEAIKCFFGVLMLATALWMAAPVIPPVMQMAAWAALGLGYAVYLLRRRGGGWFAKALAVIFAGLGTVQLAGLATGGRDPLAPLAHIGREPARLARFAPVGSVQELDAVLAAAPGRTVMLDFYADWCVSCREMERLTFSDPRVQQQFSEMVLLQADVTANNSDHKALLRRFQLFGPPGIIFFDPSGREIPGGRVVGFQDADTFLRVLSRARQM